MKSSTMEVLELLMEHPELEEPFIKMMYIYITNDKEKADALAILLEKESNSPEYGSKIMAVLDGVDIIQARRELFGEN